MACSVGFPAREGVMQDCEFNVRQPKPCHRCAYRWVSRVRYRDVSNKPFWGGLETLVFFAIRFRSGKGLVAVVCTDTMITNWLLIKLSRCKLAITTLGGFHLLRLRFPETHHSSMRACRTELLALKIGTNGGVAGALLYVLYIMHIRKCWCS